MVVAEDRINQTAPEAVNDSNNKEAVVKQPGVEEGQLSELQLAQITGTEGFENLPEAEDPNISLTKDIEDPRKNFTDVSLSENGWARLIIVAGGAGAIIGVFALIYGALTNDFSAPQVVKPSSDGTQKPEIVVEKDETGALKTQLALQSQANEIKAISKIKPKVVSEPKPEIEPTVVSSPPPSPPPPPPVAVTPPPPPPPSIDGATRWKRLAKVGSFHYQTNKSNNRTAVKQPPVVTRVPQSTPPILTASEQRIIEKITTRTITTGTKIEGRLTTAIFYTGTPIDAFTVVVTKDVRQGKQALIKKGDRLIVRVENVANSGLMRAVPTKLIRGSSSVNLPSGLTLRQPNLDPLIAQNRSPNGSGISRDFQLFALGSLSKVGEVLVAPESTSTISSSNGTFSTSTVNNNRNLPGAVLEGGFEPMLERQMKTAQKQYQQLAKSERIWFLSGNRDVTIFANRPIEIPLLK